MRSSAHTCPNHATLILYIGRKAAECLPARAEPHPAERTTNSACDAFGPLKANLYACTCVARRLGLTASRGSRVISLGVGLVRRRNRRSRPRLLLCSCATDCSRHCLHADRGPLPAAHADPLVPLTPLAPPHPPTVCADEPAGVRDEQSEPGGSEQPPGPGPAPAQELVRLALPPTSPPSQPPGSQTSSRAHPRPLPPAGRRSWAAGRASPASQSTSSTSRSSSRRTRRL